MVVPMLMVRKPIIRTPEQARFYLRLAAANPRPEYIEALIDFYVNADVECPIAEYLSIALTYARHGKTDKAREMLREVADFVCD